MILVHHVRLRGCSCRGRHLPPGFNQNQEEQIFKDFQFEKTQKTRKQRFSRIFSFKKPSQVEEIFKKFLLKQQVEQIFKDVLFNQVAKIFKDFQFFKTKTGRKDFQGFSVQQKQRFSRTFSYKKKTRSKRYLFLTNSGTGIFTV